MNVITPINHSDSITEVMLRYKPEIEAALAYADHSHSFDQIVHAVLSGKLHFYPLESSFVIMEHRQYPNWSSYHCFLAGGRFDEINALTVTASENARKLGASKLTLTGRKGVARILPKHGWKLTHVLMEHPL